MQSPEPEEPTFSFSALIFTTSDLEQARYPAELGEGGHGRGGVTAWRGTSWLSRDGGVVSREGGKNSYQLKVGDGGG